MIDDKIMIIIHKSIRSCMSLRHKVNNSIIMTMLADRYIESLVHLIYIWDYGIIWDYGNINIVDS